MKRSEIELKYTWNTDEIIKDREEFVSRLNKLKKSVDFSSFKGKLKDAKTIKSCFDKLFNKSTIAKTMKNT